MVSFCFHRCDKAPQAKAIWKKVVLAYSRRGVRVPPGREAGKKGQAEWAGARKLRVHFFKHTAQRATSRERL